MNMKRILTTLGILLLTGTTTTFAQKSCGTDELSKDQIASDPAFRDAQNAFEKGFKDFLKTYDLSQARVRNQLGKAPAPPLYIIPVVVHVMHNYGTENVSEDQINSEIEFLNLSYNRLNKDTTNTRPIFRDIAGNARIEFRLARRDPHGNPTNGIVRFYSPLTDRGDDNLKKKSVWDTKRYFNMWIVGKIARDASAGIVAGYAQFPFFAGASVSAATDGILVAYPFFGQRGAVSPPDGVYAVTATHEAGHWMGLYHPFQGDSCELENDGIQETPPRYYNANVGNPNFCNAKKDSNSCSVDNPDLPDMYEDYMDYFVGSCSNNMFTSQQVAKMHYCLNVYRRELITDSNRILTGVDDATFNAPNPTTPIANFDMFPNASLKTVRACVGQSVAFRDNSYNSTITAWSWDFGQDATPATSTIQNPTGVTYSTSGYKTVKLTVTGPNGSNTITKENYVFVEGPENAKTGSVHTADWDYQNDFITNGWYFENETDVNPWSRVTSVKYDGNASLMLNTQKTVNKFNYSLISPSYNLSGASKPYITFNYAYAPNLTTLKINGSNTTGDSQDGLIVYVSQDCGKTWLQRYKVSGNISSPVQVNPMSTLPTASGTSGVPNTVTFTPSSQSQWKSVTVDGTTNIPAQSNIRFKITFNAQGGNNFYLDNLMVGMSTGLKDIKAEQLYFSSFPNPFEATSTIQFNNPERSSTDIRLFDMLGKEISVIHNGVLDQGIQKFTIDRNALGLNSGVYFVRLVVGGTITVTEKLVIQ